MNEIVSNDYKDKLLNENYKLIYPNDLNLNMTMKYEDNKIINKLGFESSLGLIKSFKNRKNLFLFWSVYKLLKNVSSRGLVLEFRESNKSEVKKLSVTNIKLLNEQGEEYLERKWTKRIKELYLNADNRSLVIIIDEIPNYKDGVIPKFSGKRIKRGAYRSKTRTINADVNGAYNTMVKEDSNYIIGNREQLGFIPTLIKL